MSLKIYGIKNCDTMKKAFQLLEERGIAYELIDYKKKAPDSALLSSFADKLGYDTLVNRKGSTFRQLSDAEKALMDSPSTGLPILLQKSSMIKRPIALFADGSVVAGLDGLVEKLNQ
jgi:Spx/MgsR family transcriptional regulator